MSTILKAPQIGTHTQYEKINIFLAGSIDMGSAVDWQSVIQDNLSEYDVTIFNPRRDDWDSTWEQSVDNPQFSEQVNWELEHLESSDLIVYYFDPNGKAPITLMEFGLFAVIKPAIVCCPDGYWRKGNVDIVCRRYRIPQVDNLDQLVYATQQWIMENNYA